MTNFKKSKKSIKSIISLLIFFAIYVAVIVVMMKSDNKYLLLAAKIIATIMIADCSIKAIHTQKSKNKITLVIAIICSFISIIYCALNLFSPSFIEDHYDLSIMHFAVYPLLFLSSEDEDDDKEQVQGQSDESSYELNRPKKADYVRI